MLSEDFSNFRKGLFTVGVAYESQRMNESHFKDCVSSLVNYNGFSQALRTLSLYGVYIDVPKFRSACQNIGKEHLNLLRCAAENGYILSAMELPNILTIAEHHQISLNFWQSVLPVWCQYDF